MGTAIRPEISRKNAYYLSKHRYYELKHFSLQYPEWKETYASLDGFSAKSTGIRQIHNKNHILDPTAMYGETRIYYKDRMQMVETAANEAAGDLGELMLRAVTKGLSYEKLTPPCSKEVWYAAYRRFFWLLDKARK